MAGVVYTAGPGLVGAFASVGITERGVVSAALWPCSRLGRAWRMQL